MVETAVIIIVVVVVKDMVVVEVFGVKDDIVVERLFIGCEVCFSGFEDVCILVEVHPVPKEMINDKKAITNVNFFICF